MTHILPPHSDLNLSHSSLQSALQIDPNQQQQQQPAPATTSGTVRKRKKATETGEESGPAEPRRLRRSHEACARCRSKKIKCDSKYPRCTACANAGTLCQQEDRHRQTLTPRGHTERIERQLLQCEALLKRHIPGFDMSNLEEVIAREGLDVDPNGLMPSSFPFSSRPFPPMRPGDPAGIPNKFPYPHPQHALLAPGYPHMQLNYGPPGSPFVPPPMGMPGPHPAHYDPRLHPYPPIGPPHMHLQQRPPSATGEAKGADPQANDLSNPQSLAKGFGVSAAIVNDLKLTSAALDREDLAVGSSGLTSGRDRGVSVARDNNKWLIVALRRSGAVTPPNTNFKLMAEDTIEIWLPRDRDMVKRVLTVYFDRLNFHRPIFFREEFERTLEAMYEGKMVQQDPGFICSLYLVLALGTLSELNHRVFQREGVPTKTEHPLSTKELLGPNWPEHEEFFECALVVKPDLRVTVSSLQALILLHWYLYTERQGRTLWRLVGSFVRLGIELGLHHDPTGQGNTFSEDECQLRTRLWSIVLLHDRGTSILLGRPLAIAPSDSNAPHPTARKGSAPDVSEHFLLSAAIVEIQADIINSLYTPSRHMQNPESIMRHATRIIKNMAVLRDQLPESYKAYFGGTEDLPMEKRSKIVQDITEDEGLTLLKIGISRILLLRSLFSSKQLEYGQRHKALDDAIVTSHNIIIVHNQLIRFPDTAFFVSPIPLHIAAMVILFGHMSRCDRIPRQVALEDVWMALDMLPSLRWRWERKDLNGGHPLIAKLAEKVLEVNLHQVGPPSHPMLLSEQDWEKNAVTMSEGSQQQTPTQQHATPKTQSATNGVSFSGGYSGKSTPKLQQQSQQLVEVPTQLFYPFFPEKSNTAGGEPGGAGGGPTSGNGEFDHLLAAAAQPINEYGYHPSQDSFMLEEKDTVAVHPGMQIWMNNGSIARAGNGPRNQAQPAAFKF